MSPVVTSMVTPRERADEWLSVRGLTTAATLWRTAALGSLAASAALSQAAVSAVTILGINLLRCRVAQRICSQGMHSATEVGAKLSTVDVIKRWSRAA